MNSELNEWLYVHIWAAWKLTIAVTAESFFISMESMHNYTRVYYKYKCIILHNNVKIYNFFFYFLQRKKHPNLINSGLDFRVETTWAGWFHLYPSFSTNLPHLIYLHLHRKQDLSFSQSLNEMLEKWRKLWTEERGYETNSVNIVLGFYLVLWIIWVWSLILA